MSSEDARVTPCHVAAMKSHGVRRILTFDTALDGVPGVVRLRT